MPLIATTITASATNITGRAAFGSTYTAPADCIVMLQVALTSLNGAAATITPSLTIQRGATTYNHASLRYSVSKLVTSSTAEMMHVAPVALRSGDVMQLYLHSTNGSDTVVAGVIDVFDLLWSSNMRGTDSAFTGTPPSPSAIEDQILDALLANHTVANSIGAALNKAFLLSFDSGKVEATGDWITDVSGLAEKTDLPANFAALGISASGHLSRVTLVDTTTANTDMLAASNVWSHGTRLLTAGTNIVLAKGTGITGFNDIDASGVQSALTAQGYTTDRAAKLDNADVATSTRATPADVDVTVEPEITVKPTLTVEQANQLASTAADTAAMRPIVQTNLDAKVSEAGGGAVEVSSDRVTVKDCA